MTELIHDVNPLMISTITVQKGWRHGEHPMLYALHRRKWGFLAWKTPSMFDSGWFPACVVLRGPTGKVLKYVVCKSNAHAEKVRQECIDQMNVFLKSFRRYELQEMIAREN